MMPHWRPPENQENRRDLPYLTAARRLRQGDLDTITNSRSAAIRTGHHPGCGHDECDGVDLTAACIQRAFSLKPAGDMDAMANHCIDTWSVNPGRRQKMAICIDSRMSYSWDSKAAGTCSCEAAAQEFCETYSSNPCPIWPDPAKPVVSCEDFNNQYCPKQARADHSLSWSSE